MHRLLQGEVGSGKTVVALRAMLAVVDAGGQAALLAPTEVLAQQHYRAHRRRCSARWPSAACSTGDDAGTRVALLTGSLPRPAPAQALLDIASGAAGIVIGTHALLQEQVDFAELGLVVVDEQHRFGVEQRAALPAKAGYAPPHVLVMTATPIPRTVAMTVFGDLDVSTLRELPAGRVADRHASRARRRAPELARAGVAAGARGGGGRAPGLRRLSADRRRAGVERWPRTRRPTPTADEAAPAARRRSTWLAAAARPVRSRGCGSTCCTAGCRPRRRTT